MILENRYYRQNQDSIKNYFKAVFKIIIVPNPLLENKIVNFSFQYLPSELHM